MSASSKNKFIIRTAIISFILFILYVGYVFLFAEQYTIRDIFYVGIPFAILAGLVVSAETSRDTFEGLYKFIHGKEYKVPDPKISESPEASRRRFGFFIALVVLGLLIIVPSVANYLKDYSTFHKSQIMQTADDKPAQAHRVKKYNKRQMEGLMILRITMALPILLIISGGFQLCSQNRMASFRVNFASLTGTEGPRNVQEARSESKIFGVVGILFGVVILVLLITKFRIYNWDKLMVILGL